MKLCVTGGRNYDKRLLVQRVLHLLAPEHVGVGCAAGADALTREHCLIRGIPYQVYEADWAKHGNMAGPYRNRTMLDAEKPDVLIAFPGGRGTEGCIREAKQRGIVVFRVDD